MRTLKELGYRFYWEDFLPNVEKAVYTNGEKNIVFWKDGDICCYSKDYTVKLNLTDEEIKACHFKENFYKEVMSCDKIYSLLYSPKRAYENIEEEIFSIDTSVVNR